MATLSTTDFRKNLKILYKDEPWVVEDAQHVKPGKGVAFVKSKIRNLITGRVLEKSFRSGDSFEDPEVRDREMQYLYNDGEMYHFMDTTTYEQVGIHKDALEDSRLYLVDNMDVDILFWEGRAINITLPNHVTIEVEKTDPGLKGDTASGGSKPAVLTTGATVSVPLYINEGEKVKVDTRSGEFVERVNE
jgi:elongation factor P